MFRSKRCRSRSCCLNSRDCVVAELPRWRLCTSAPAMVSVLAMQAWPLPPYGVCLSVCLSVMFVDGIATNKCIFGIVSPSGSKQHHSSLCIPNVRAIFRWVPPNGGVECKWGRQKSRSQPISGSIACCERFDREVQSTQL